MNSTYPLLQCVDFAKYMDPIAGSCIQHRKKNEEVILEIVCVDSSVNLPSPHPISLRMKNSTNQTANTRN
jgi:hypothetical protein